MTPLRYSALLLATAIAAVLVFSSFSGSALAETPPNAPSHLGWYSDMLYWQDNSDNETGFRVLRTVGDGPAELWQTFPANTTSVSAPWGPFEDMCADTFFTVVAFNDAGESAPSNEAHLPPPPSHCPGPFRFTFTNNGAGPAVEADFPEWSGVQGFRLVANAPGCPEPQWIGHNPRWPTPCVDPGESITMEFDGFSPIFVRSPVWLIPTFGDARCDGATDAVDALMVLRDAAGLQPLTECGRAMGDTNHDGHIDAVDALRILRAVTGLPGTTP